MHRKTNSFIPTRKPILSGYTIERTIGQGGFGKVKLARELITDEPVAIKVIEKSRLKGKEHMLNNEIAILKQLDHNNIIKLYQTLENSSFIYIIMEYVPGGDLLNYISKRKRLDSFETINCLWNILDALEYLHENGVCHRFISNKRS